MKLIIAAFVFCISLFPLASHLWALSGDLPQVNKPIVIELFTSQSCSSCPPADKLLGDLAHNPNVIALGYHVTYWNHLMWKDPLSREFSTQRQKSYSAAMRSSRVYTPQMVVNGYDEFVGSNRADLRKSVGNASDIGLIKVSDQDDGMIKITLPQIGRGDGNYTVWLYGVKSSHEQFISSGENRNSRGMHVNSALRQLNLGSWSGALKSMTMPIPAHAEIDRYIVLAQSGSAGYGPIVAAGQTQ